MESEGEVISGVDCATLARELENTKHLQKISSLLIEDESGEALYHQILDAAMAIMRSDFSSIQLLDEVQGELHLLAWKNFHPDSAAYWQTVSVKTGSTCGSALRHAQRIIVSDVETSQGSVHSESLKHCRLSGIAAVQSTPLTTREGRVIGMMSTHWRTPHEPSERELVLFDVLVRQTADMLERRRVQDALKETDRRKDEFLAVLAHELRNPLFPIKNALYVLQQTKDYTVESQQLIQMMDRQVNHMVRLVDYLLEISRISTGKIELHKENINLADAINNAIEATKPLLDFHQHELTLSLPVEPLMITADMVRMTQIFANLLNNAARFTANKGKITVKATVEKNNIIISVQDNGRGISAEMLPKIFDMFAQDKQKSDLNNSGLGVGLAMVRNLTELHAGTVSAYSEGLTQGCKVVVSLPLEKKSKKISQKNKIIKPEENISFANLRVLVVDDNIDITTSLAMLLKIWKMNVQVVNNGKSVLTVLDKFNPHVVLLDIGMPDMDGYAVAEKIRQNPTYNAIKLVALTGWSQEKDRAKSHACGFNAHLAKPVVFKDLRELLSSFCPLTS